MLNRWFYMVVLMALLFTWSSAVAQEEESYLDALQDSVMTPAREIEDFTVTATTGEDFTLSENGGQILLVYFGYMTCPDVCPTTLNDMRRAYEAVGEPIDQVKMLFITLDPERDDLERMSLYTQAFHDDLIGLRTDDSELLAAMMSDFGVVAEKVVQENSALGYTIDHSAAVYVVAPDGRIIEQFPYGVAYTEISHDLEVLLDYMDDPTAESEPVVADDSAREFRIVIPLGTGDQISMGEDPGIIPLKIELTLGERDILVLENHDYNDFLVGGIWVAPYETVRKQFYEPQTFVGLCTVTVGRDLVEIIVSAPVE